MQRSFGPELRGNASTKLFYLDKDGKVSKRSVTVPAKSWAQGPHNMWADPEVSGRFPPQYANALNEFWGGAGLNRNSLAEFNKRHKKLFLDGAIDEATGNYKSVSSSDLFKMLNRYTPGWMDTADGQRALASWGRKPTYQRDDITGKFVKDQFNRRVPNTSVPMNELPFRFSQDKIRKRATRANLAKTEYKMQDANGNPVTLTLSPMVGDEAKYLQRAGGRFVPFKEEKP
jgi:hypothetical protein